ncbi:MAG TPA: hypothetical protein ENG81_03220 [Candidatus Bathyarchaeota archaeon]|nr:hypothetical protein [Candidatus Bathyarchaeota archaeon]
MPFGLNSSATIILAILKCTREKDFCSISEIKDTTNLPAYRILEFLIQIESQGLIELFESNSKILCKPYDRLKLAIFALNHNVNPLKIALFLDWREFERICLISFEEYEYRCFQNFRFKIDGKFFEMDIIGVKDPFVICVDCKRWSKIRRSQLRRAALKHLKKVILLSSSKYLEKLEVSSWNKIIFIPVMLTIYEDIDRFYRGIPIIPVYKFNSFLKDIYLGLDQIEKVIIYKND